MTVASYSATLVQYVVYARTLGVGRDTDALAIAIAWATVVAGLITTTLTAVALPPFVRHRLSNPRLAQSAFRSAVALAIGSALVLATLTAVGGAGLASVLSPASGARPDVARLVIATAPLIVAWTIMGILLALANATEHYGHAAASGVAPSAIVIGALVLSPNPTVEVALVAYIVGSCLQIAWLTAVDRRDLRVLVPIPDRSQVASLARRGLPVVLTFVLFNCAILVTRAVATIGRPGDVAVFDYAARLVLAGQQVLLAGVLAVALTKWSQMAGSDAPTNPQIGRSIALALGLAIPAAAVLAILAPEIVQLLLTGGRFSSADATRVAEVLRWMAPGVAAGIVVLLGFRALTAYQSLWAMAGIGAIHLLVLAVAAPLLQRFMGVDGISLAYSIAWIAALAATLLALRPLLEQESGLGRQALATAVATLAAAVAAWAVLQVSPNVPGIRLVLALVAFTVAGWAVGYLTGVEFVRTATRRGMYMRPSSA
jgi:putative peptidoglycan lipid II flippase